jgi:hypothetical protein
MQTISPELQALLKSRLQAGSGGFRGRLEILVPGSDDVVVATGASWRSIDLSWSGGALNAEPAGWRDVGFDDSGWEAGYVPPDPSSVWASVGDADYLANLAGRTDGHLASLVWIARKEFEFNVDAGQTVALRYVADDSVQMWLNGVEIVPAGAGGFETVSRVYLNRSLFVEAGTNCLAIKVTNFSFAPNLWGNNPTMVQALIAPPVYAPFGRARRISIDKSLRMVADQASVELANEDLPLGWGSGSVFPTNSRCRIYQWYGDAANEVRTFTGLIDKVGDSRDPLTTTITARDMMALLIDQTFSASAPQGADEDGAVRTRDNGVYLSMEVSDIVSDMLDRAGWPEADRNIVPTSYVLDEFVVPDGASWAEAIIGESRLTGLVGYSAWADELGVFHFAPTLAGGSFTEPTEPAYTFRSGEDITALDDETDQYELRTRVKVRGPLTTQVLDDTWRELWRTTKIAKPVGIWHDPTDATHLRVLDRSTKRLYRLRQSDRVIVSSVYVGAVIPYPLGLSGDPGDSSVYWVLNAPWFFTGSTSGNSVKKVRKSDNVVLASYAIPNGRWSAIKVSAAHMYLTNLDTDRFYRRSKTDASAVADYSHTVGSTTQLNPSGIMVNGTTLHVFWYNSGNTPRFAVCEESAPGTVAKVIKTTGTTLVGGEFDSVTGTECWGGSDLSGIVAKFTLIDVSEQTDEVFAEVVDTELEDELGLRAGSEPRVHDTHPGDAEHPYMVRRLTLDLSVITSLAQATETAQRTLELLARRRRTLDAGILGNPALQKADIVAVVDPVTGISSTFAIDTYRTEMGDTYLGTLALTPVRDFTDQPEVEDPAEDDDTVTIVTDTSWKGLELSWDGGVINAEPAGWREFGFDDSGWEAGYVPPDPFPTWYDIPGAAFLANLGARTNGRLKWSICATRKEFTLAAPAGSDATLTVTADNWCEVYLDDVLVLSLMDEYPGDGGSASGAAYRNSPQATTIDAADLGAGDHCIAVRLYNGDTTAGNTWSLNPMAVQLQLVVPL